MGNHSPRGGPCSSPPITRPSFPAAPAGPGPPLPPMWSRSQTSLSPPPRLSHRSPWVVLFLLISMFKVFAVFLKVRMLFSRWPVADNYGRRTFFVRPTEGLLWVASPHNLFVHNHSPLVKLPSCARIYSCSLRLRASHSCCCLYEASEPVYPYRSYRCRR